MQGIRLKTILNVFFGFWNQPYDPPPSDVPFLQKMLLNTPPELRSEAPALRGGGLLIKAWYWK